MTGKNTELSSVPGRKRPLGNHPITGEHDYSTDAQSVIDHSAHAIVGSDRCEGWRSCRCCLFAPWRLATSASRKWSTNAYASPY